jgi:8-hydroxy-5-deazaflavin:NADPH oxidoreductase
MKVAIIGLGNIGTQVANNLMAGGRHVLVADHGPSKANDFAKASGDGARAVSVGEAIAQADIIVLAVYFSAIKELINEYRNRLAGKIIVDPSNPIAPDGNGGFKKIIPQNESAGQILAGLLPPGVRLVKAFGTLGAASLKSGARHRPDPYVLFYASDDVDAGTQVADLITASGFTPVRIGGLSQAIRIEVFGDLHEFGKLGKLITRDTAAGLVG